MTAVKHFNYKKKTRLYAQEESHPWVYHVVKGFVLIDGISVEGKHGITDLYGAGNWFSPGLADGMAIQNATAQSGCELERLTPEDFAARLQHNTELAQVLVQQLSRREHYLQQRLFFQQTTSLPVRLAQLLCYLFDYQGQVCQHGHDQDVRLSQQELANMAGGSRQTVSQLLLAWKQQGAIDYTRGYVCLEDRHKLKKIAEA